MNTDVGKLLISKNYTIEEVLKKMDQEAKGLLLVVNEDNKLIGTITDGDIRRAILSGLRLEDKIEKFVHQNPVTVRRGMSKEEVKDVFIKKAVKQIPVLDKDGYAVDLITINDILLEEGKENVVIIMAGGLGTRLKDLTKEVPKPMLRVGESPILQHIINNFKKFGYNKILISVNYKYEIIENYFQDGYAHGVKINYLKETKRLGTGGGIKLAKSYIDKPFVVVNGDVFTNVNIDNMMQSHMEGGYAITVGTKQKSFHIPYGVINVKGQDIDSISEKPEISYLINGGVYCLNPSVLDLIPEDEYFEITDLINKCIENNMRVGSYEIKEYWMDIGQITDYNQVNEDYYNTLR